MKRIYSLLTVLAIASALLFTALVSLGPDAQAQTGVTGFSNVRVSNFYRSTERPTLVVVTNGTLNPTGTHQPISSTAAAALSGASITVKPDGSLLILRNVGAQSITFTETGTLISAGNIVLAANDSATLLSDGTNWIEIGASNN